jgi:TetR/AcrR family transcriptional regulator
VVSRVRGLERLDELPEVMMKTLGAEPWIAALMVQEVLSEGGRYRERFVGEYASHMARLIPERVRAEIASGRLRADLDPSLAMLSLIGMAAFPFVARPILERVFGLDYDADFVERLAEHTRRVFFEGMGA